MADLLDALERLELLFGVADKVVVRAAQNRRG